MNESAPRNDITENIRAWPWFLRFQSDVISDNSSLLGPYRFSLEIPVFELILSSFIFNKLKISLESGDGY